MVFLGFALVRPIADPDIWWHLSIGDWILANKTLPTVDHWTTLGEGNPFRAYSWLPEILFSGFYSIFGSKGLMTLLIILTILLGGSLCYVFGYFLKNQKVGVLIGTIVLMALSSHSSLRPQAFVWIYLIWLLYILERVRVKEISSFWVIPIAALWANTHLSTALGILITSIFLLPTPRSVFSGSALFFLGTLLTPYYGGEWLTFFEKLSHPVSFVEIAEFQPATFISIPVVFVLLLVSMIIVTMFQERTSPRFPVALLTVFFTILGLFIVKFLPFSIIFLSLFLVTVMRGGVKPGVFLSGIFTLENFVSTKVVGKGFGIFLVALIIVNGSERLREPLYTERLPEKSVEFIKEKSLKAPVISTFSMGGYLGFSGIKPAFDGRTNLIPQDFWVDYIVALQGFPGYERFLERTKPETLLWMMKSPLPQILKAKGDWCEAFREKGLFVVLVKKPNELCGG